MAKRSGMPDLVDVPMPMGGMVTESSFSRQPEGTTRDADNVLPWNLRNGLNQLAQREGTTKFHADSVDSSGNTQVQDIIAITTSATPPGDGTLAFRTRTLLATAAGNITVADSSSGYSDPAGGTGVGALNDEQDSPVVFSEVFQGVVYFADGTNWKKYTASTDTVAAWSASAGTLPANGSNLPRLIATWQGRIWLAGIVGDEHNWFGTKLDDPTDFDFVTDYSEDDAVSGNTPDSAGKNRDIINCLMPYSSDIMLLGGDHTIVAMDGLPTAGGRLILMTDATGMSWGRPFCFDENGVGYFHGSRGGIYRLASLNEPPERMTRGKIDNQFTDIDYANTIVRMAFDSFSQSLFVFLTDLTGAASTHWRWDRRTDSWWKLTFADAGHNPTSVYILDGDDPDDRLFLMGCRDSKIRYLDTSTDTDDGTAITSHVWIGPFKMKGDTKFRIDEMQAVLDEDADSLDYSVHGGGTVQAAYNAAASFSGRWKAGRNASDRRRVSGRATFIQLNNAVSGGTWGMESLMVRPRPFSYVEQRRIG